MDEAIKQKFEGVAALVGNTPLLEIDYRYKGNRRRIFAKAEYFNVTGSIKDRVAYHILKRAYERDEIGPDDIIAEATSGNTGISFSAIGSYLGHQVVIYMPDWMSKERINLMKSYGAQVRLVSKEEGGFLGSIAMTEELYKKGGVFLPRQFSNEGNAEAHYLMTGEEIVRQLAEIGLKADGVVAGVGTGGTVTGVGWYLKSRNPAIRVVAVEPASSPVLSKGTAGAHKIQGIGAGFVPDVLDTKVYDEVIRVKGEDAFDAGRRIARTEGVLVGISSGAALWAAIELAQREEFAGKHIVVLLPDTGDRYLSTAMFQ